MSEGDKPTGQLIVKAPGRGSQALQAGCAIELPSHHHKALQIPDRLGDLDLPGAGFGAVVDRVAAPQVR